MASDSRLQGLIEAFAVRPDAQACRDGWRAYGGCLPMALRFAAAAREAGLAAEVVALGFIADDGDLVGRHYVTVVGDVCVDWTARQFDPLRPDSLPVPALSPAAGLPRLMPYASFEVADRVDESAWLRRFPAATVADWPEPDGALQRRKAIEQSGRARR